MEIASKDRGIGHAVLMTGKYVFRINNIYESNIIMTYLKIAMVPVLLPHFE